MLSKAGRDLLSIRASLLHEHIAAIRLCTYAQLPARILTRQQARHTRWHSSCSECAGYISSKLIIVMKLPEVALYRATGVNSSGFRSVAHLLAGRSIQATPQVLREELGIRVSQHRLFVRRSRERRRPAACNVSVPSRLDCSVKNAGVSRRTDSAHQLPPQTSPVERLRPTPGAERASARSCTDNCPTARRALVFEECSPRLVQADVF
jgi:hypothetical protein